MYAYENYFLMNNISEEKILSGLYKKIARSVIKKSINIPLHSTFFDINLKNSLWEEAIKIQNKREYIAEKHYQETGKIIKTNLYYSDFDNWLRGSDSWISFYKKILKNKVFLEDFEILKKGRFNKLFFDHFKGNNNNRRLLIKLASMEIFIRSLYE